MSVSSRKYEADTDFQRVRDFLIETYGITQQPFNWTLERWDYCRYFVNTMWGRDPGQWEDHIRVWENDGQIVGVACYEDGLGQAYPQVHPFFLVLDRGAQIRIEIASAAQLRVKGRACDQE